MSEHKLYMVLLGSTPPGRTIEQHDIFFGIGCSMKELVPAMKAHWKEAKGRIHVDAYQQIQYASGYEVTVLEKGSEVQGADVKLFFINLGGYKPGEFEEYHYKMVVAAKDKGAAIKLAKATAFYKHTGYKGAESHVDDKYGIDVDDAYAIEDILASGFTEKYIIILSPMDEPKENEQHIGYFKIDKLP